MGKRQVKLDKKLKKNRPKDRPYNERTDGANPDFFPKETWWLKIKRWFTG